MGRALIIHFFTKIRQFLTRKAAEVTKQKEEKRENLSPRNRRERHSIHTALLQSIAEIGTQSTIKCIKKTLHELSPHIPQKRRKGT
jgi:hypothetical protein